MICFFGMYSMSYATNDTNQTEKIDISYYDKIINNLGKKQYFIAKNKNDKYFSLFIYPCNDDYNHWDYTNDDIYFYMKNNVLTCRNSTKNQETSHFADYRYDGQNVRTVHSCWSLGGDFFVKENINAISAGREVYTSSPVYKDVNKNEIFFQEIANSNNNNGDSESGGTNNNDGSGSENDNSNWFINIIDWLSNIASKISNLANDIGTAITSGLTTFFQSIIDTLGEIGTFLWELPR